METNRKIARELLGSVCFRMGCTQIARNESGEFICEALPDIEVINNIEAEGFCRSAVVNGIPGFLVEIGGRWKFIGSDL